MKDKIQQEQTEITVADERQDLTGANRDNRDAERSTLKCRRLKSERRTNLQHPTFREAPTAKLQGLACQALMLGV
jgi:hypothetical protein